MKLASALSPLVLAAAFAAGPAAADTLDIHDFVGRIDVKTGNSDRIEARIVGGEDMEPVEIDRDGDTVSIDGGWENHWSGMGCRNSGDDLEIRVGEGGGFSLFGLVRNRDRGEYRPISDYPLIEVTAPADVVVEVEDSLLVGEIGNIGAGRIASIGCGTLRVGNVDRELSASNSGSGEMTLGNIGGNLTARLAGSGELYAGHIGGDLEGSLAGSGNLVVGDVDGEAEVRIAGSGDVELGEVARGADLSIAGSGDMQAVGLSGDVEISITGSGDVTADHGSAGLFKVNVRGSGDVRYGGQAERAEINVAGSGDVTVGDASVVDADVAGSGEIRVGASTYR